MVQTTAANTRFSAIEASSGCRPASAPGHQPDPSASAPVASISFYMNEIPEFAAAALDRLYGNLYSSLAHFGDEGKLHGAITYVVQQSGDVTCIFLFRIENGRAHVLNEVICLAESEIRRFTEYVFAAFRAIQVISFRAVQLDIADLSHPYQRFNYLENIVVSLPDSTEKYLEGLSKTIRRNMRRYLKYLRHDFPAFVYETFEGESATEQDIREIIALNHARMSDKNKMSDIDETETARLISLVRRNGLVGIASINGRVAAGVIIHRTGANYLLMVLAHDPQYNTYGLGALCCYLSICDSIRRGAAEFHFLWGRYDYKYWFGGVQRDLDQLAIYRSRAHFLWNGGFALRTWFSAVKRQAVLGLRRVKQQDNVFSRLAIGVLNGLRNLRDAKKAAPER